MAVSVSRTENLPLIMLSTLACAAITAARGQTAPAVGYGHIPVNPAEALEMPTVEIIGTTPLPGLGTPIQDVPSNVQVYTSRDLARQNQTNVSDFLEQNGGSISTNAAQGNPFQPDISFRGFAASPLLGTPQGMSVFQDGARINEPFGDIVNWDLIPQSAIAGIQLVPGSNPAFGLNTLGGALALYTKSGAEYPGGGVRLSHGSFGRKTAQAQWGGVAGSLDYFVTGEFFDDRGWADHNPSRVRQLFSKVGWQNAKTDLDLSLTLDDNRLEGTQTLPRSFLGDIEQAYTFPDVSTNRLTFLTLKGSRFLSPNVLLGGNAYFRQYRNDSLSSNVNGDFGATDPATGLVDMVQATNDKSATDQHSYGGGLQVVLTGTPAGMKNQLTLGGSADAGTARFTQSSQDARFTMSRDTVGTSAFSLGTDAELLSRYEGVFAADTLHLAPLWTLSLSGRHNRATIRVEDRTGEAPLLNGEHTFSRFNSAIGLNFNPTARLTTYAGYNEGVRPPTAIELTCADPSSPCKLPNDFVADPPLRQIVSRTIEAGARGTWTGASRSADTPTERWNWSAAFFRTSLDNDIEFIAASTASTNSGYFASVGKTRRQGIELALSGRVSALTFTTRYAYTDATFESHFRESSPSNSTADQAGAIQVRPGDRIPGVPEHSLKIRLDWAVTQGFSVGANTLLASGVYARGDENNLDANGRLPGWVLVNLDSELQVTRTIEVFARVANLLDRRFYDFGVLAEDFFTGPNHTFGPIQGIDARTEQFRGPGAPRGIWVGVRYAIGETANTDVDRD